MKKVLIPWSGGLDSTYLVWKNLSEGNEVTAFYVEIINNRDKTHRELAARSAMSRVLKRMFPGKLNQRGGSFLRIETCGQGEYKLTHPTIFLLMAGFAMDYTPFDAIQIGYVMNDDAVSYIDEIRAMHAAYGPFRHKNPAIEFPLIKTKKNDIVLELPKELLEKVTWCEYDDETGCSCLPCVKMRSVIAETGMGSVFGRPEAIVQLDDVAYAEKKEASELLVTESTE